MGSNRIKLANLVSSISEKYVFNKDKVIFLNTSDLYDGKVINHKQYKIDELPGQAKKSIKRNDVLFSEIRPKNRRFAFVDFEADNYVVSTKLMVLRTNSNLLPRYLYYFITSPKILETLQNLAESRSGTFPQITFNEVKSLSIHLPSIDAQQKIVSITKAFDDKIELNNEMNKTLEEIAQAIFKHWFVDFEFPNENGEPYKSSGGEFEDSELGPIPKGWKVKSLDEIADFLNGLAMQKYRPKNEKEYLPVLKIKELRQGETSQNSDKCTNKIKQRYIVNDGDIIFSWSGSLLVKIWCGGKAGLNQHLFKVTSNSYPKWFYYRWIKHYLDNFRRIAEDKATTMGHIKREHLKHAKVIVPNEEELNVFDKVFDSLIEKYISNKQQIKTLSQLRDTLLPKLISGEIRVV